MRYRPEWANLLLFIAAGFLVGVVLGYLILY